ncbi:sugar phosphate nucleotidyltransferase [Frigidibacter sp. SD6-1]|uniref:UTP--glucose-1-phosphate uridylyltransferase n=1 Tax=Frigidibacter sp. SD6-1 TaxID=3032581 RepID=UPI0024DF4B14|nr:sugar phosphate nucleotidyltransferase [Frigidibacter sp. SD6-1]
MGSATIRTAILPVAGLGTRLLPATKTVPKELLPVYDTPLLQFALQEAASIPGIERLVVVTHESKKALEQYFDHDPALLRKLRRQKKHALANCLQQTGAAEGVETRFAYQDEARGLGHAVLCAARDVAEGPVAVILPDDLVLPTSCMAEMAQAYDPDRAGMMVAAMKVAPAEIGKYGAFDVLAQDGAVLTARGIVEKPAAGTAPSLFAAVGRYILPPDIFDQLARTAPGHQGEIQLTDAISALVPAHGLEGLRFSGQRFDCGTHEGLLAAGLWRRDDLLLPAAIAAQ